MSQDRIVFSTEDTRERVLRTSEMLFAQKGVENVNLRELTAAAGVNLGAVTYHFGSKEALAEAVFDSLSARVNARRSAELEEVLAFARARHRKPSARAILLGFLRPYIENRGREGELLAQLVLKHRAAPNDMTRGIISRHFDPMARRYVDAFVLACPQVPREEFYWRYMFLGGSVVLMMTDREGVNRVSNISKGAVDGTDTGALFDALLRFLLGGISAR